MKNAICIVVPIYKNFTNLSKEERSSIYQLFKILGKFNIYFIYADDFDFSSYHFEFIKMSLKYKSILFNKKYFKSPDSYNQLLLSQVFYKKFRHYKYLLIYQTDAWVFKDELNSMVKLNFDYIGAPFFENYINATNTNPILGGNGGFSLRNNEKILIIFRRINQIKFIKKYFYYFKLDKLLSFNKFLGKYPVRMIYKLKYIYRFEKYLNEGFSENEDIFWSIYIPYYFTDYKVAPFEISYKFSFETNPSYLYQLNNNTLPFGTHAWQRYEPDFWKDKIGIY